MTDMNILDLFLKASLLVKLIMLILIGFQSHHRPLLSSGPVFLMQRAKPKRLKINSGLESNSLASIKEPKGII
ncbi:hypothetical protein DMI60_13825 [Escherichia coli]|nr:hypothetical protein [Escherichia coli]